VTISFKRIIPAHGVCLSVGLVNLVDQLVGQLLVAFGYLASCTTFHCHEIHSFISIFYTGSHM